MLLILDLDDTIFETQSMSPEIFAPVFLLIEDHYKRNHSLERANALLADLWKIPFDAVAKKYDIPVELQNQFLQTLNRLEYDLKIGTFSDYPDLLKLQVPRILVTSGFRKLQKAKIKALNIETHFEEIHIDDPFQKPRNNKRSIFQGLLATRQLAAHSVWIIGDNPDSEIKAGKDLGMNTIQRLKKKDQIPSPLSDFSIHSFAELAAILNV